MSVQLRRIYTIQIIPKFKNAVGEVLFPLFHVFYVVKFYGRFTLSYPKLLPPSSNAFFTLWMNESNEKEERKTKKENKTENFRQSGAQGNEINRECGTTVRKVTEKE